MATKSKRFHIILDDKFRELVEQGAHKSWMSVGQYIRDCTTLFKGCHFDEAADTANIGREIGHEAFEALILAAERKKMPIKEFCLSLLAKPKAVDSVDEKESLNAKQLNLFDK